MGKEIEIPEGYEAKIENNKVIFVPKESEDERIRKMIENTLRDAVLSERISETSYREMLAYLEKQKEQPEVDLEKVVEFESIGKKVKMTVQDLINYYIDSECCDVADECGF